MLLFSLTLSTCVMAQTFNDISYETWTNQLKKVELNGEYLAYFDDGQGPTLLMIHGVPTSSWLYRHMAVELVEKGFRVIIPDMMGYGQSAKPNKEELVNFTGQAESLQKFHESLGLEDFYLVVHDAGGIWAWQWLAEYEPKVKGLILLNTILYLEGFNPPMRPKKESFMHRTLRWAYKTPWIGKTIVKSTLKQGIENRKLSKADKHGYTSPIEAGAGFAIGSFFGALKELEAVTISGQDFLVKHNTPICAIWGEKDPFLIGNKQLPLAMSQLNLPKQHTHILYGCGHFIQEEAPQDISRLIEAFTQGFNE